MNGVRGLEHGFTLRAPHELRLTVRGGLRARATAAGVEFMDAGGTPRVKYTELAAWDATGKPVPATIRVDGESIVLALDDRGARYPVTIDPIVQQAYLTPSNAGGYFGDSVAVSGNTVVVGAYGEGSDGTGVNGEQNNRGAQLSGAAFVFVRNGATWTQQAYLKASNAQAEDLFGSSVAISGDTIVAGAPGEASSATGVNGNQSDNTAKFTGAAYVFVRNGTTWTQQAYLKASNTQPADPVGSFGKSAGVSGDSIVVGAGNASAYVFVRSGVTWTQQAHLRASNPDPSDIFGAAVAISRDTVVVGASGEASNATGVNGDQSNNDIYQSGAAYIFVRNGVTWTQQAYLKASKIVDYQDLFGSSVAIDGDTVVVGAYNEDSNATGVNGDQFNNSAANSGAAYVYVRNGTTWTAQAYLKASNSGPNCHFGYSVAVSGDTVVVGHDRVNDFFNGPDAAYVFVRSGSTWSQEAFLNGPNAATRDYFGHAVAVSGNTILVGAYGADVSNIINDGGAASVFVPAAAANLNNFGFETPVQSAGGFTQGPFGDVQTGWYFDANAGVTANNSIWTSANSAAPEGVQSAFIRSTGSISQVVGGFQPGVTYRVGFKMAQRVNNAQQSIRVTMTGTSSLAAPLDLGTYTFAPGDPSYRYFVTGSFVLQSGSGLLTLQGLTSQEGTGLPEARHPPATTGRTLRAPEPARSP